MDPAVARRLQNLHKHINPEGAQQAPPGVVANAVSASASDEAGYSVVLPEVLSASGPWQVYRSKLSPEKLIWTFPKPDDHIRTLYDNFQTSAARFANNPYLGTRKLNSNGTPGGYAWLTYAETEARATAIGSGLLHLGLAPGAGVGIFSINSAEWMLVDTALQAYSMVSVPLYDTLGPDAVKYICSHAELAAVACSADVLPTLLGCLPECPTVRHVIVYGQVPGQPLPRPPPGTAAALVTLDEVERAGRGALRPHVPPAASDTATLCYTSGTTGVPKGAVLSHANLISNVAGSSMLAELLPTDRHISYLPLAHIYERTNVIAATRAGSGIGFYRGRVEELLDDIQVLRPTVFCSVPRLWNRIFDKVMAGVRASNPVSRRLFAAAYEHKRYSIRERGDQSGGTMGAFWDRLVFSKLRNLVGGQVRMMTSGASPISPEVLEFLRIVFGARVVEGYGMTETACLITATTWDDFTAGHVGGPNPACEVKLEDIPEMGYRTSDQPYPRGEICVRGPCVFQGYLKEPGQTAEVLDPDGWLHTGDVGRWLPGGRLSIIDRKKNLFKLAQGEYIAPEKVENTYARSPYVAQAFVYGDSLRAQLVAVVVPDPEVLFPWAAARGLPQDLTSLCRLPEIKKQIFDEMQHEARVAKLRGFEQVADIHLVPEPFSVENGLLTPTLKLKRPQAQAAFKEAISRMYAGLKG